MGYSCDRPRCSSRTCCRFGVDFFLLLHNATVPEVPLYVSLVSVLDREQIGDSRAVYIRVFPIMSTYDNTTCTINFIVPFS